MTELEKAVKEKCQRVGKAIMKIANHLKPLFALGPTDLAQLEPSDALQLRMSLAFAISSLAQMLLNVQGEVLTKTHPLHRELMRIHRYTIKVQAQLDVLHPKAVEKRKSVVDVSAAQRLLRSTLGLPAITVEKKRVFPDSDDDGGPHVKKIRTKKSAHGMSKTGKLKKNKGTGKSAKGAGASGGGGGSGNGDLAAAAGVRKGAGKKAKSAGMKVGSTKVAPGKVAGAQLVKKFKKQSKMIWD
eukprot:NODE_3107_length_1046_cov_13.474423_g2854_i0.p1 GENE.NODE_3107_length_1046_cov_13.474423_g2854_i0~~NODE_3107_length_1046_cov_13.474423_g2854_i0.p1  ORF type:complete len:251 (+),score=49.56 NODE_3107_length_1046_cov_13.474423_g2854_i0:29-754(+)